jgi:hypothetical protein
VQLLPMTAHSTPGHDAAAMASQVGTGTTEADWVGVVVPELVPSSEAEGLAVCVSVLEAVSAAL